MPTTDTDRRQHGRTLIELAATLERVGGRTLTGPASTIDLSEGGARLVGPAAFAVADVVRVAIRSGDLSIEHQGLIVGRQHRSGDTATLNVAFKTLDPRDRDHLRQLIELD